MREASPPCPETAPQPNWVPAAASDKTLLGKRVPKAQTLQTGELNPFEKKAERAEGRLSQGLHGAEHGVCAPNNRVLSSLRRKWI